MNHLSAWWKRGLILLVLACGAVIGIKLWQTSATNRSREEYRQQYMARVRAGLSEVAFASQGSSHGEVRASVESVARFIRKRSGVNLNHSAIARLTEMEEHVLNGNGHRILGTDLGVILRDSAYERVAELTDQEIDGAIETLRGFDAPDLPNTHRRGRNIIYLRADRGGPKVTEKVFAQARSFRDQARAGDETFRFFLGSIASQEVSSRGRLLNEASPNQFPADKDSYNAFDVKLTPVQAVLFAYSVISDDHLLDAEAGHQKYLKFMRDFRARSSGGQYPDPHGRFAYGTNGYLYSSPLDLFLNDQAVERILERIERRTQ